MGGVGSAQVWLCGSLSGENGCPVSESIGSVTKEKAAAVNLKNLHTCPQYLITELAEEMHYIQP